MKETTLTIRQALAGAALRRLAAAQLVSTAGDFLAIFAVLSVISFRLHGTAAETNGLMIAWMLPQAFVAPLAGVFVDRWNARTTMIASDLLRAALILLLAYSPAMWQIFGIMMAISALSSFFTPAQAIAIRRTVPLEGLMAANALMMMLLQITQIAAPGVAGWLSSRMGPAICFRLDAASFLFSAATIFTIRYEALPRTALPMVLPVVADLKAGARHIFAHPVLAFAVLSMAGGGFAAACYNALIAIYARDVLGGSAALFGILGTLAGVGTIIGTQVVTHLGRSTPGRWLIVSGLCGVAAGFVLLAVFRNTGIALAATLGIGFGVALAIIPAQTLMQRETPAGMLGRVSGSLRAVLAPVQIAALGVSGAVAQTIGARTSCFAVAGLLMLIASVGMGRLKLLQIDAPVDS
jgi:MFS family permease